LKDEIKQTQEILTDRAISSDKALIKNIQSINTERDAKEVERTEQIQENLLNDIRSILRVETKILNKQDGMNVNKSTVEKQLNQN
jgi:hypothetical protein